MTPLDERVARLEKDIQFVRDEAARYRSDIAVRDELYSSTGSALLTLIRALAAQLATYREQILRTSAQSTETLGAFDLFITTVVAELTVMIDQYEAVFSTVADLIS